LEGVVIIVQEIIAWPSGDSHLLDLNEYKGIKILSARKFLEIVEKD